MTVTIDDGALRVVCHPAHGFVITELTPRGGENLLWRRDFDAAGLPERARSTSTNDDFDDAVFLGGWFGMFPTAGIPGAADDDRVMHGDLPRVSWTVTNRGSDHVEARAFARPGFEMTRRLDIRDGVLMVSTSVQNLTDEPLAVAFGEHPCLSRAAFAGGSVALSARSVVVPNEVSDPAAITAQPGAAGSWPFVPGLDGRPHDMSAIPTQADGSHDHLLLALDASLVRVHAPGRGLLTLTSDEDRLGHLLLWRHFRPVASPWQGDVFSPELISLPARSLDDPGARDGLRTVQPGATLSWCVYATWTPATPTIPDSGASHAD